LSYACALLLQLQEREPKSLEEAILGEGKKHECGGCSLLAASKQQWMKTALSTTMMPMKNKAIYRHLQRVCASKSMGSDQITKQDLVHILLLPSGVPMPAAKGGAQSPE
jgi:hypothetical protein